MLLTAWKHSERNRHRDRKKNFTQTSGCCVIAVSTGIPQLVRFQIVRSPVYCGFQTVLNSAKPRFSAVFSKQSPKKFEFSKKKSTFFQSFPNMFKKKL